MRRGGELAASKAGSQAASMVAARPSKPPLTRLDTGKLASRTVRVKKTSLIV